MRASFLAAMAMGVSALAAAWAQQPPDVPPPPPAPTRVEAKKQVIVNWSIGDQAWDFRDILSAYEPVSGYVEIRGAEFRPQAVWTLRLAKDLEQGTVNLHQNVPGTPFRVIVLDEDRAVIDPNPRPVQITPVSGKAGDTVKMVVDLPAAPAFNDVKLVRVERRTNVGF